MSRFFFRFFFFSSVFLGDLVDHHRDDANTSLPVRSALGDQPQTVQFDSRTGQRHAAEHETEQPTDGFDVVLVDLDIEQFGEVFDGQTRTTPGNRRSRRRASSIGGTSSLSYSSLISPTISSSTSSMVNRPATPPYSSTSTAMWLWLRCMSASTLSSGLESGMNSADASTRRPRPRTAVPAEGSRCTRSLR